MKTVPVTYTTKNEFTQKDFRRHAGLLADKIETLPAKKHNQSSWTRVPKNNPCGTTGCALGIAVMSHIIPGLQFKIEDFGHSKYLQIQPTINGESTNDEGWSHDWYEVGIHFFGDTVYKQIFKELYASKAKTIERLRRYAETGDV